MRRHCKLQGFVTIGLPTPSQAVIVHYSDLTALAKVRPFCHPRFRVRRSSGNFGPLPDLAPVGHKGRFFPRHPPRQNPSKCSRLDQERQSPPGAAGLRGANWMVWYLRFSRPRRLRLDRRPRLFSGSRGTFRCRRRRFRVSCGCSASSGECRRDASTLERP